MVKAPQTQLGRTARLLDLVPYLASHQGIDLETLANYFDVTTTQMIADLTTLWMCGLPGYTPLELMDLSFESGFVHIYNAETLSHPRTLNDEESIALLLGLDLVIESLPIDRNDLKILAAALVDKLSARSSIQSKLSAIPSVPGSVRAVVENSINTNTALEITYHSSYADVISQRIVTPLELREEGGLDYLWAICHKAHAARIFRLDRIQSAAITARPQLSEPSSFPVDTKPLFYKIRTLSRAREVMERFSLDKDSLTSDSEIQSYSREWIKRSVFASSGSAQLLAPLDIRTEIATTAALMLDRYNSP